MTLRFVVEDGQPIAPVVFHRMEPEHLLAAYWTLRPGEVNHRLLADVPGEWLDGWVSGYRGEEDGFPAFLVLA